MTPTVPCRASSMRMRQAELGHVLTQAPHLRPPPLNGGQHRVPVEGRRPSSWSVLQHVQDLVPAQGSAARPHDGLRPGAERCVRPAASRRVRGRHGAPLAAAVRVSHRRSASSLGGLGSCEMHPEVLSHVKVKGLCRRRFSTCFLLQSSAGRANNKVTS